jgi:hypothetical protein
MHEAFDASGLQLRTAVDEPAHREEDSPICKSLMSVS